MAKQPFFFYSVYHTPFHLALTSTKSKRYIQMHRAVVCVFPSNIIDSICMNETDTQYMALLHNEPFYTPCRGKMIVLCIVTLLIRKTLYM